MKNTPQKGVTRARRPVPAKARRRSKPRKTSARRYLKSPELTWMDRLLRSLNQVAPKDWVPPSYQSLLNKARKKKATITLH